MDIQHSTPTMSAPGSTCSSALCTLNLLWVIHNSRGFHMTSSSCRKLMLQALAAAVPLTPAVNTTSLGTSTADGVTCRAGNTQPVQGCYLHQDSTSELTSTFPGIPMLSPPELRSLRLGPSLTCHLDTEP